MKHQFTEDQIRQALTDTSMGFLGGFNINGYDGMEPYEWESNDVDIISAFLDALPDQQPTMMATATTGEACDYDDVRDGDRIRIETIYNNLYEITVAHVDSHAIGWKDQSLQRGIIRHIQLLERADLHPDPAHHPVILVDVTDGNTTGAHPFVWTGAAYAALTGPVQHLDPDTITDWKPADIVPKVVPANE